MARSATSRKNLFGFGRKKVTTFKHRGSTRRDISSLAFKAGQRSGDTGLFSSWADSKSLKEHWDRDALRQFEKAYRDGVEKGEEKERRIEEKREAKAEKREAKQKAKEELQEVQSDVIEALAAQGMSRSQAKALARSKFQSGDSFDDLFHRIMRRSVNPYEQVQLGDFAKRFGTMREGTITVQKPRVELIRKEQKRYGGEIYEVVDSRGKRVAYALVVRRAGNPAKFDRCVSDVSRSLKKAGRPGSAYAICTAAGTRNPADFDAYWEREGEKAGEAYPLNDYIQIWNVLPIAKQLRSMKTGRDVSNDMTRALPRFKAGFERGKQRSIHKRLSRKNPESELESAKKAYKDYTGLPATKVTEVKGQTHRHSTVFKTGQLICLDVILPTGKQVPLIAPGFSFEPKQFLRLDLRHSQAADDADATWIFDPAAKDKTVMVTFSTDGRQMMFTGGDQSMPLEALGFGDRDMRDNMFIGTIVELTYREKKKFEQEGKEEVDFHHPFGGQGSGGILPLLGYFLRTKQMFSIGGRYKIAPVRADIGASPGIIG